MLRVSPVLALVLALAGCDEPAAATEADSATDGALADGAADEAWVPDTYDCHHDCFGSTQCEKGVVSINVHTPVPCAYWTGSCPRRDNVYVCARGCRRDGTSNVPSISPELACEEFRVKAAGDPCASDADCLPTPAKVDDATKTITNTYLRCDTDAGVCVAATPPMVPDWQASCGAVLGDLPFGRDGWIAAASCSTGICVFGGSFSCLQQGCSVLCDGDHDCPPGGRCRVVQGASSSIGDAGPDSQPADAATGPKKGACFPYAMACP